MRNASYAISIDTLQRDYEKIRDRITRQNTPWFKSGGLKKTLAMLMILSEATALVATILTFNNTLSPLFTAPITIIYCIAFIFLGYFQGKTIGAFLTSDELVPENRLKVGMIINAILVCLPIASVGILRWATRELGQRLTESSAEIAATFEENAFGIIIILLPLLIYLCEVFLVTAEVLYDHKKHELWITDSQYSELQRILNEMKTLYEAMPSEEERRKELIQNDDEQYYAAIELVEAIGEAIIIEAVYELMKEGHMDADDVSRMTAELNREVSGYDVQENDDNRNIGNYYGHDDAHDGLRAG